MFKCLQWLLHKVAEFVAVANLLVTKAFFSAEIVPKVILSSSPNKSEFENLAVLVNITDFVQIPVISGIIHVSL